MDFDLNDWFDKLKTNLETCLQYLPLMPDHCFDFVHEDAAIDVLIFMEDCF